MTTNHLPPRLSVKHRPKHRVEYDEFDSPIGPTYSPTRAPPPGSPKTFGEPKKRSNYRTTVIIIVLALALVALSYYYLVIRTRRKPRPDRKPTSPPPQRPKYGPSIGPATKPIQEKKLYQYRDEEIFARVNANNRRSKPHVSERNVDPVEFWISGLFEEKILSRKSTCQVLLPKYDDLVIEKDGTEVEFDPRVAKNPTHRCESKQSRLWVHENEGYVMGRCENDAIYRSGRDRPPVRGDKLFKSERTLINDKQKNGIPLEPNHEVMMFECKENDRLDQDIRVRIATNNTLLDGARQYHDGKEHPLNVIHIVIEGASRANFMRQMRNLVRKIESFEYGGSHRVFQYFRYSTVGKNKKQVPLSHPTHIWSMAKSHGHVTLYATSQCPYVQTDNQKLFKTSGYTHSKFVDHNLSTLFCNVKDDHCLAGKNRPHYVFDYARDYMKKYGGVGRTALLHFYEHEMGTVLDGLLSSFVDHVISEHPHTTIILSAGGYGQMNGEYFYSSLLGQLEAKLPLLITIVPEFLKQKYPKAWENMYHNQQMITTPNDLIRSIETIIEYPSVNDNRQTLFTHKIDSNRTCQDAGISDRWCMCDHRKYGATLFDGTKIAKEAAKEVSHRMHNYDMCEWPIYYDSVKVSGSSDDVIAWTASNGVVFETVIKTKKTRIVSELPEDNIKVRNNEVAMCNKSSVKRRDRGICVCKDLKPL
jgi:hypothetical protein